MGMGKSKTCGFRLRQSNKTTKETIIIIEYAKQTTHNTIFSHHPMTNCAASSQAAITELADFAKLVGFTELMEKERVPTPG